MATKFVNPSESGDVASWKVLEQRGRSATIGSVSHGKPSLIVSRLTSLEGRGRESNDCQTYRGKCCSKDQGGHTHTLSTNTSQSSEITVSWSDSSEGSKGFQDATESSISAILLDHSNYGKRGNTSGEPIYPLRRGVADCQYYLKTGKCNYGPRCKFNHPFRDENLLSALNRRDCFDFVRKGTCPYGKSCKYNHPSSVGSILNPLDAWFSTLRDSVSSPRSISPCRHKFSASEPQYSTGRNSVHEAVTASKDVKAWKGAQEQAGRSEQEPVRRGTALDSSRITARGLLSNITHQEVDGNITSVQTINANLGHAKSIWTQNHTTLCTLQPPGVISEPEGSCQLTENFSQTSSNNGCQQEPLLPVFIQNRISRRLLQSTADGSVDDGLKLPCGDILLSNNWSQSNFAPRRLSSGETHATHTPAARAFNDREEYRKRSASNLHIWETSPIWRTSSANSERESFENTHSMSFDSERPITPVMSGIDTPSPIFGQGEDRCRVREWTPLNGDHYQDGNLPSSVLTEPSSRMSNRSSLDQSFFHGRCVQEGGAMAIGAQNLWGNPRGNPTSSLEVGTGLAEMHHLRGHQRQQYRFVQRQIQGQDMMRHKDLMREYSRPFSDGYVATLESVGKAQDQRTVRHLVQQNIFGLDHSLCAEAHNNSSDSDTTGNLHSMGFDPTGYRSLLGNESSEHGRGGATSNMWRPTEKSPLFGPGLFGMDHYKS